MFLFLNKVRKIVVKYSRKDRVEVPDLLGNLARNLIGSYRVFIGLLAKAKVKASEHKGERDSTRPELRPGVVNVPCTSLTSP